MKHNLPTEPTQLVGREGDLTVALECLNQPSVRLLTLLGPGGVGKTRLAVAIAELALRSFPDGVWFVDLVPLTDPDQVVPQIASALDLHDTGDQPILGRLKRALADRPVLLVLDNFEHVFSAAASLVELLRDCLGLKVLVTSRVSLQVRCEQQFPVAPLALPDLRHLPDWKKLTDYASVRLFVERARMVQPSFRLTHQNAETIAAICDALDGLPLAIELAAARVKSLSINAIWDWLSPSSPRRPLQILAASYSDVHDRQLSLRAAIDWSYRLLSAEEQTLFRQLSIFAGDFSLEAAELLSENEGWVEGAPSGSRQLRIFDDIASLVDKSLLLRKPEAEDGGAGEARYQMLQTIREFGREQLFGSGELPSVQRRHAFLFTTLAEDAEREQNGPAQTIWFNRLSREWDNLRAALRWCLDNDPETGLRLAGSLDHFWEARDESGEGRQWLEAMLARAKNARPEVLAKAFSAAGTTAWRRADYRQAMEWHRQSLELYRSCGDQRGCALALNHLGVQHINLGNPEAAAECYEECVKISREIGDAEVETFGLINLGILALNRHELDRARCVLEEALALARRLESERILVYVLHNLGEVMLGLGETQAALDLQRECVQRCYNFDHKTELAYSLEELAGVYQKQGMLRKASQLFGAADALREFLKVPPNPVYRQQFYEPTLQALRDALGAKAFAAAWSAGRASPLEEAVADALADPEPDQPGGAQPSAAAHTHPLSRREREVAALIAQGMSNREIAEALVITEGTAANHVAHIMNKLGCHSRAQIASWAAARGLVSAPLS